MIIRQSTLDNGQFLSIMINSKCDKANKNQPKQNLEHWWTSNVWHFYNLFGINPSEFQEFSRKYYENCVRPTILDMTHTQTVPQKIYCKFLRIFKKRIVRGHKLENQMDYSKFAGDIRTFWVIGQFMIHRTTFGRL